MDILAEAVPKLQFLGDKLCLSSFLEFSGKTGLFDRFFQNQPDFRTISNIIP
jgi:hypothetical protein